MSLDEFNDPNAAGYPLTSQAEAESRDVLMFLLDKAFVRGEIKVMDKIPNIDGTLELINAKRIPIGKFDVQLKTLDEDDLANPKYSCPLALIGYSALENLPLLLIVVDRAGEKAYWRNIDEQTRREVLGNIGSQKTYTITIPLENIISKKDKGYIEAWKTITEEWRNRRKEFDKITEQNKALAAQLAALQAKLDLPADLPEDLLKDFYKFIDHYNYILDYEFPYVKKLLYARFWKIGIAIIKSEESNLNFILFPVEFNSSQPLVKTITKKEFGDFKNRDFEWRVTNIIIHASYTGPEKIRQAPYAYAYDLLKSTIIAKLEKNNLPIDHAFVAHEYLISFIDKNFEYLGFEPGQQTYPLAQLEFLLRFVLPMLEGMKTGYADWVRQFETNIDTSNINTSADRHQQKLLQSVNNVRAGTIPPVSVTITSSDYGIDLIYYYIHFLQKQGETTANRLYGNREKMYNKGMVGVDFWKTWNIEQVWQNFILLMKNFPAIYKQCVEQNFPALVSELVLLPDHDTSVLFVLQADLNSGRHYVELFYLRSIDPRTSEVFFHRSDETTAPMTRRLFVDGQRQCVLGGKTYFATGFRTVDLTFMFHTTPTYRLLQHWLIPDITDYLTEKSKRKQ